MRPAKYVWDTGPFIRLSVLDPDVFVSVYAAVGDMLTDGTIVSCKAVFDEIDDKSGVLKAWCTRYKSAFTRPGLEEQLLVRDMLDKYQYLLKQQDIVQGKQVADPFVIARGKHLGVTVVTTERFKPNAQKIPNVCKHYDVESCDLMGFFKLEGLTF